MVNMRIYSSYFSLLAPYLTNEDEKKVKLLYKHVFTKLYHNRVMLFFILDFHTNFTPADMTCFKWLT